MTNRQISTANQCCDSEINLPSIEIASDSNEIRMRKLDSLESDWRLDNSKINLELLRFAQKARLG